MAKVTHKEVDKVVRKLPKECTDVVESLNMYYRYSDGSLHLGRGGGIVPDGHLYIPVKFNEFYNKTTKKRLPMIKIETYLYNYLNGELSNVTTDKDIVKKYRAVNKPKSLDDLKDMKDGEITKSILPLMWLTHGESDGFGSGASVFISAGKMINNYYVYSGYHLAEMLEDALNYYLDKHPVDHILRVGLDPESGMFSMFARNEDRYDLYISALAILEYTKSRKF